MYHTHVQVSGTKHTTAVRSPAFPGEQVPSGCLGRTWSWCQSSDSTKEDRPHLRRGAHTPSFLTAEQPKADRAERGCFGRITRAWGPGDDGTWVLRHLIPTHVLGGRSTGPHLHTRLLLSPADVTHCPSVYPWASSLQDAYPSDPGDSENGGLTGRKTNGGNAGES